MPHISIIIPIINEAEHLESMLMQVQVFRAKGNEVIVVDGGSRDASVTIARAYSDLVLISEKGRAKQMNAGANAANGDVLIFLHADTVLPLDACELLETITSNDSRWGRFDVRLSGDKMLFRIIEYLMNWRSKISSIATGDQAIFVSRKLFDEVGGFPDMPLMEDVAISKRLKQKSNPICLKNTVLTSSRRWEEYGILRTVLLMWRLRFLYFIGVPPERLVKHYR